MTVKANNKNRLSNRTSKAARSSQDKIHSTLKFLGWLFTLKAHHKRKHYHKHEKTLKSTIEIHAHKDQKDFYSGCNLAKVRVR